MGSNWKTARLLDQYEVRSGLSKPAKDFGTGYPFLTFKDVFYNYFTPEVLGDLVESTDKERDGCSVKRGDVFLTRTSETMNELGMSCVALKDYEGATFNGFCKRLRPNEQCELVPEYVGYYLRSPKFRQAMVAFSTMSTRASLNNEMIGRLEISYPPKEAQRHIAHVLKTLDNKITLNRQINQTLEQMAQALFKSWFVDFDPVMDNALDAGNPIPDELQHRAEARKAVRESEGFKPLPEDVRQLFPDAFEESELGWVPKGWKPSNVGAEFDVTMGQSPPGSTYNELGIGIPFFQGKTDFGFRYPTNRIFCSEPKRLAEKADTLISVRAPVGDINLAAENCAIGRGLAAARHKSGSPSFTYYAMSNLSTHFEVFEGEGTVFGCINQKDFKALPQIKVTTDVIAKFDEHCGVWDKKIETVSEQIGNLTKLRDTLLPKLISGELRLDEIELAVEQEAVSAEQQNER
ncbi:TPA: restriction endonuclease subunit S [Vibrio cholerae]